jgi:hypothetical protein
MGFWDFFKKKSTPAPTPAKRTMVDVLETYKIYITCYLQLQHESNPAPIAAYVNKKGELIGYVLADSPEGYALPLSENVNKMMEELRKRLKNNEIQSFICFYHSDFARSSQHDALDDENDCSAISIHYEEADGLSGTTALPYEFKNDSWAYAAIVGLSSQQTQKLINNNLESKDYFTDINYVTPPTYKSAANIPMILVNQFGTGNLLNGIFGYNRFQAEGLGLLQEQFAKMQVMPPLWAETDKAIYRLNMPPISLQVILQENLILGAMPLIDTDVVIDTETKAIAEWDNLGSLLAVVSAAGRQTFGIKYIAMDYGINAAIYETVNNLNIKMSAVILVADQSPKEEPKEDGTTNFSPNFVGYLPHKQLAPQAGIEFTGLVEYFEEVNIFEGVAGYIIRMQLINTPDNPNMFTIDMYAAKDNMRFQTPLQRGMSISGVAIIQGVIAD